MIRDGVVIFHASVLFFDSIFTMKEFHNIISFIKYKNPSPIVPLSKRLRCQEVLKLDFLLNGSY